MFKWLSKGKRECPEGLSIEETRGLLLTIKELQEHLSEAQKDIINLNTAVNRVERKQSRWLEILNERELSLPGDGEKPQTLTEAAVEPAIVAGEPTEL